MYRRVLVCYTACCLEDGTSNVCSSGVSVVICGYMRVGSMQQATYITAVLCIPYVFSNGSSSYVCSLCLLVHILTWFNFL